MNLRDLDRQIAKLMEVATDLQLWYFEVEQEHQTALARIDELEREQNK